MRYGNLPSDLTDSIQIQNIQIVVRLMSGKDHTLFTDDDNETFLDVKIALLPHLHKPFDLSQLVFHRGNNEIGYENVDDGATISSQLSQSSQSLRVITLELILKEWTREEQAIFDMTSQESFVIIFPRLFDTLAPGKMEAAIQGLEINDSIKSLQVIGVKTIPIMRVFREKTTLEELKLSHNGMNADEMAELFDIIGGNTSLHTLAINNDASGRDTRNFRRNTYRMNDLSNLLRTNTSLCCVTISDVDVEIDGDLSDIVLSGRLFVLQRNRIVSEINRQALIDSLPKLSISDNEINFLSYE